MTNTSSNLTTIVVLALLALTVFLTSDRPSASEDPHCGEFSVYLDNSEVTFVDHDSDGATPGDKRSGYYGVLNESGTPLGSFYFAGTVVPEPSSSADGLLGKGLYALPGGSIAIMMHYHLSDASDGGSRPTEVLVYPVVGGTGDFFGAQGTLTSSDDGEGRRSHTFQLTCLN